jgi:hypothetical protein
MSPTTEGHLRVAPEPLPFGKSFGVSAETDAPNTLREFVESWEGGEEGDLNGRGSGAYIFQQGDPTVASLVDAADLLSIPVQFDPPGRYGARFSTGFCTRGCHWIPRMFA